MKEKERYRYIIGQTYIDNETDNFVDIVEVVNQQDKRIKELEAENGYLIFIDRYDENGNIISKQEYVTYKNRFKELLKENNQLKQQLAESEKEINRFKSMKNREQLVKENESLKDTIAVVLSQKSEWIKSCDQLKQQLHDLPKKIVEEIKRYDINVNKQKVSYTDYVIGLSECLDTILKKYGGENEKSI